MFKLRSAARRLTLAGLGLVLLPAASSGAGFEGFGAATSGGRDGVEVSVTSLADSGPGTLREALKGGERRIVFKVGGLIHLRKGISIKKKSFITIQGSSAPPPGITLVSQGIYIWDSHDIVVESIRVRNSAGDGITIKNGSYNIVVDHCSLADSEDENMSVTNDSRDVTLSWSVLGDSGGDLSERKSKGVLIAHFGKPPVTRVSLHHNLIVNHSQRSPQISTNGLFDVRNNLIWNWRSYGVRMRQGARGNIVGNSFRTAVNPRSAVVVAPDAGRVFIADNRGPDGVRLESLSSATAPFPVPPTTTDPVEEIEERVLGEAGVLPRDATDRFLIGAGR